MNVCCCSGSPVLISLVPHPNSMADAFPISTLENGVHFAISANEDVIYPISWPLQGAQLAFVVHLPSEYIKDQPYKFDGVDLFGNFTPQKPPAPGKESNGYAALSLWDLPENGGNGDGLISVKDRAVQLGKRPGGIVLWVDEDHDGVAQPSEIFTFAEKAVESIEVSRYSKTSWTDSAGNQFRYTAPVNLLNGRSVPSYDVYLLLGPSLN